LIARPAGPVGAWNDVIISAIAIPVRRPTTCGGTFIAALVETIAAHGTGRTANNRTNDGTVTSIAAARIIADDSTSEGTNGGTCPGITFHIASCGACAEGASQSE
jgi:hypothetical protein